LSKLWELVKYVEAQPHDHAQRWRLAKKLYAAWEYRLALEHLQVLQKDQGKDAPPNLFRYLAATYYRLKRYDETLKALTQGLESWPKDVGLWEQRARTLKATGKLREAAAAWHRVAELDPENSQASKAAEILKRMAGEEEDGEPSTESAEASSSSTDSLLKVLEFVDVRCPHCDAENSQESRACWRCGRRFEKQIEDIDRFDWIRRKSQQFPGRAVCASALVVLFVLSVWLSFPSEALRSGESVYISVQKVWMTSGVAGRLAVGGFLLLVWPFALYYATLARTGNREPDRVDCAIYGVLLALLTYTALVLPTSWFWLVAVLLPIGGALVASWAGFELKPRDAVLHFGLQMAIVAIPLLVMLLVWFGWGVLSAPRGLWSLSTSPASETRWDSTTVLPSEFPIVLIPSGSSWLDRRVNMVAVEAGIDRETERFVLDVRDPEGRSIAYEVSEQDSISVGVRLEPGRVYSIRVAATSSDSVRVRLFSPLRLQVQMSE
jgi:tetratricopeptide (TPR) repeat protein